MLLNFDLLVKHHEYFSVIQSKISYVKFKICSRQRILNNLSIQLTYSG